MRMARFVLLFREFQCDRIVSPAAISIGIPEKAIEINTIQIIPITQLFSQIFCSLFCTLMESDLFCLNNPGPLPAATCIAFIYFKNQKHKIENPPSNWFFQRKQFNRSSI